MATNAGTPTFKQFESEDWHRQAPNYDDRAGRTTTAVLALLLDAVGARPGMRLLDVCCGLGYLAAQATARGLSASASTSRRRW
jgi:ubiquinone/menaquinone biosynthesis C-methylase UbiE